MMSRLRALYTSLSLAGFVIAGYELYKLCAPEPAATPYEASFEQSYTALAGIAFGIGVLVGIVAGSFACSRNIYRLERGKVVKRRDQPAHIRSYCYGFYAVPNMEVMVPAKYWLKLEFPVNGRTRTGWIRVSKTTYDEHPVDTHYHGPGRNM